jgi:G protein-coupled receptor Mth (Methuselah protein)
MISIPFLLATLFIYGFIPELRNLHGKCLMCYIVSLLLFYLGLIIVNCEVTFNAHEPSCIVFGYFVLIGVQFCFFWLNVMCYDLWSAFKVGMTSRGSDKKRFLFYCLYAFGVPILFIFIVYIIDSTEFIPKDYRPEIGLFRCYIKTSTLAESIYVYIPISIILLINIALYSITAMTIYRVQKETAVIRRGDSQTHSKMESDRNKFTLYLRLFVLMGVTWTMEAISFYLGKDHEAVFYITDILNCIQGVIIFFMFVWKPKIKKLIVRR